jgi:ZIP family zinc transporter
MPVWLVATIPVIAVASGAWIAAVKPPGKEVTSGVQHFAAGLVFAAAAAEILPDLKHQGHSALVIIGGALGVAAMLVVRHFGERAKSGTSLAIATSVDVFVDGLVLGMGAAAGSRQATLLVIALTTEILFLGLSVSLAFAGSIDSKVKRVAVTAAVGLALPVGVALGFPAGQLSPSWLAALFAFALVALLYLVTEELLVEAHQGAEGPVVSAMFFVGFLGLLLLDELVG